VNVRLGIDVGGTFMDLVGLASSGEIRLAKVPSDPRDPLGAIRDGLAVMGWPLSEVEEVVLGTTLATNTVLEKKGARTALLCTEGFRDILEQQRWRRRYLYDLQQTKPEPLAPRSLRLGIKERVSGLGELMVAVDSQEVEALAAELREAGVESVAICYLNAHQNGANEAATKELLLKHGGPEFLSLSSEVAPLIGEWERTSTTLMSAYVQPIVKRYFTKLSAELNEHSPSSQLLVMQSNGGILSAERAGDDPVRTILSGPAAGVSSASSLSEATGIPNMITLDMGGTSTDVAVIQDGIAEVTKEGRIEYNVPITIPMMRIETIGAGGGSLIWVDVADALKVGPGSAGAFPGPACYDRGGTEATITDAQMYLGRLPTEGLLGGRMAVRPDLAQAALAAVAERVGLSVDALAAGAIRIANAKMAAAVRVATVDRGIDPREFALLPFGGAGPLHACEIADELGMGTVLVPATPGVFSAVGLVTAATKVGRLRSVNERADDDLVAKLAAHFAELESECSLVLEEHNVARSAQVVARSADVRYAAQSYTVQLPFPDGPVTPQSLATVVSGFHDLHRRLYKYATPERVPVISSIEVAITDGSPARLMTGVGAAGGAIPVSAATATRRVYLLSSDEWATVPAIQRRAMAPGRHIEGPAVIDQSDSTVLVEVGYRGIVDQGGNLLLRKDR
jgi:N-methylhydantoinase A